VIVLAVSAPKSASSTDCNKLLLTRRP